MNLTPDTLESLLTKLGTARQTGVIRVQETGSANRATFPWQVNSPIVASARVHTPIRRLHMRQLAIAAVVGLVLVGAWALESLMPKTGAQVPGNTVVASHEVAPTAVVTRTPTDATADLTGIPGLMDRDLNGDGVVDGDDIQLMTNSLYRKSKNGSAQPDASEFVRTLLSQ